MPNKSHFVYWDSCVFIDYLKRAPHRISMLDDVIAEVKQEDGRIVTSVLSVAEVTYAVQELQNRKLDPSQENILDAYWGDSKLLLLVEVDEFVAREARQLMRQILPTIPIGKKLPIVPPDAIHMATAKRANTFELHTFDSDLHAFGSLIGRTICDPKVKKPRLFS